MTKLGVCTQVLEEMEAEGHQKNALTHRLIVQSHLARRDSHAAVEGLFTMRAAGFKPDLQLCDQVWPHPAQAPLQPVCYPQVESSRVSNGDLLCLL